VSQEREEEEVEWDDFVNQKGNLCRSVLIR